MSGLCRWHLVPHGDEDGNGNLRPMAGMLVTALEDHYGPAWPWTLGELKSKLYSSSFVNHLPVSRVKFLESRKVKYFGDYLRSQGSDDLGLGIFGYLEGRRSISMLLHMDLQWPGLLCAMHRPQPRQLGCSVSEVSGLGEVGRSPLNPYNHFFSSPFLIVPYGSRNDIQWQYFRFEKVSPLYV